MAKENSVTPVKEEQVGLPLFTIESVICGGLELRNIVVRDQEAAVCVQEILIAMADRTELLPYSSQTSTPS